MTGFTGSVILRGVGRGKQLFDTPERVEVARAITGEFTAVVGFNGQRCADGAIEAFQGVAHGGSRGVFQRHALNNAPAGEVTDIEDIPIDAIDGCVGLPDVSGPDGAGCGPGAGDHGAVIELLPEVATEARRDLGAIAERHIGKVRAQGANTDAGAEERQMVAQLGRHGGATEQGWSAQRRGWAMLGDAAIVIALPGAQAREIDIQRGGDVSGGIASGVAAMDGSERSPPQGGFHITLGALGRGTTCMVTTGVSIVSHRPRDGAHAIQMTTVGTVIGFLSGASRRAGRRRWRGRWRFFWR